MGVWTSTATYQSWKSTTNNKLIFFAFLDQDFSLIRIWIGFFQLCHRNGPPLQHHPHHGGHQDHQQHREECCRQITWCVKKRWRENFYAFLEAGCQYTCELACVLEERVKVLEQIQILEGGHNSENGSNSTQLTFLEAEVGLKTQQLNATIIIWRNVSTSQEGLVEYTNEHWTGSMSDMW